MALKNYTTVVKVDKTCSEIQKMLVSHGARKIMFDYDVDGRVSCLMFVISTPNGERGIKLPANITAAYEVLKQQRAKGQINRSIDYDQAERTAWRIIRDWVDAQMAILETQMVQFEEIFLPYMVDKNNQTFFEAYKNNTLMISGERGIVNEIRKRGKSIT